MEIVLKLKKMEIVSDTLLISGSVTLFLVILDALARKYKPNSEMADSLNITEEELKRL